MKRHCLWCKATSDPDIVLKTLADLELKLGPDGCCAPDGDGHSWIYEQQELTMKKGQHIIFGSNVGRIARKNDFGIVMGYVNQHKHPNLFWVKIIDPKTKRIKGRIDATRTEIRLWNPS